jgi:HAE1 family hydrophobic/amphiphilic exporter-1
MQFESFLHPITILLTLPLAVPFGILSLLIAGDTINIFLAWALLLFGIVKKNAILRIDHTNGLREKGRRGSGDPAANRDRLQPHDDARPGRRHAAVGHFEGVGSATNRSIGVLVVGGQSLCLLLTLLAVPVFYSLFDDLQTLPLFARVGRGWSTMAGALSRPFAGARKAKPAQPRRLAEDPVE